MAGEADLESLALRLTNVFTPAAPINSKRLFVGRKNQVRQVVDAINQPGQHAILYGERGVGKTSLGHILKAQLYGMEQTPIISPLITCDASDDYNSIWRKVFDEIEEAAGRPGGEGEETYGDAHREFTPHDVRRRLEPVSQTGIVYIILDEFDKVQDDRTRLWIADTIKLLSDRAAAATLVIIGVSDDVHGLIEEHQSIERCLAQVQMPRMPREELAEIVLSGFQTVGMSIDETALREITGLSKGLPHYTHLLSLEAGRQALDRRSLGVTPAHVTDAIRAAIGRAQESIRHDYDRATYSSKKNTLHKQVLLACALSATDEFGWFQPGDICGPLRSIAGRAFTTDRFAAHLKAFCGDKRSQVLRRTGGDYRWRYRFFNPLMQPYVIMKSLEAGLIDNRQLDQAILEQDARDPRCKG